MTTKNDQIVELQRICSEAYQMAGTAGVPASVLDLLLDAAEGRSTSGRSMLPIGEDDLFISHAKYSMKDRRLQRQLIEAALDLQTIAAIDPKAAEMLMAAISRVRRKRNNALATAIAEAEDLIDIEKLKARRNEPAIPFKDAMADPLRQPRRLAKKRTTASR